jgi:hypothetical protein
MKTQISTKIQQMETGASEKMISAILTMRLLDEHKNGHDLDLQTLRAAGFPDELVDSHGAAAIDRARKIIGIQDLSPADNFTGEPA